ncbi:hypothetical protein SAMN02745752_02442 [Marinospirillum alkaliphilum DSM 21637]|uniref:Uncharacterized protein n=1 Tax=Marinospirillum alkaliphilum DSM 21637 TaxID=1122209 RepID=A0A1K1YX83_9GAMM|nr:hypothetical protein SAMN02745752_02442 [Marinospirillum alkaliphilum DSM 21637]
MLDAIFNIKNRYGKYFLFFCFFCFLFSFSFYIYFGIGGRNALLFQLFLSCFSFYNVFAFVFNGSYYFPRGGFFRFEKSNEWVLTGAFYILIFFAAQFLPVLL